MSKYLAKYLKKIMNKTESYSDSIAIIQSLWGIEY